MTQTTEERLQLLEDERAILRRLYTYGHSIDYGYEDEFVDCWVPDGVLYWPDPHPPYKGHDALREIFRKHTHAPDRFHKHMIVEPQIEIDGDRATADSMFTRLDDYPDGPAPSSYGRYRDKLVRCDDGKWRFVERLTEREASRKGRVDSGTLPPGSGA
jgi:ketosteroid isomerase-like protein